MAYCVHCGVKLHESEKRCPLCSTVVIDPQEPRQENAARPYPVRLPAQEIKRSKRFFLGLSTVLLLVPGLLCLMIDLLLGNGLTWSIYPGGVLILLFIDIAVPLLLSRFRLPLSLLTGFFTLAIYLFGVEIITQSGGWFFPIVLPSLGLALALAFLTFLLYRLKLLNKFTLLAASMCGMAIECLGIEILCDAAVYGSMKFTWSPFVAAPLLFAALLLFFVNANRAVREEVRRRVHF
ncbi:MAG: hypothetical protein E7329_07525 [Clostridiales bacterium]|nr:hypothetical protein [Clostridiales bacterium]